MSMSSRAQRSATTAGHDPAGRADMSACVDRGPHVVLNSARYRRGTPSEIQQRKGIEAYLGSEDDATRDLNMTRWLEFNDVELFSSRLRAEGVSIDLEKGETRPPDRAQRRRQVAILRAITEWRRYAQIDPLRERRHHRPPCLRDPRRIAMVPKADCFPTCP